MEMPHGQEEETDLDELLGKLEQGETRQETRLFEYRNSSIT
jgi:hypothetical protein